MKARISFVAGLLVVTGGNPITRQLLAWKTRRSVLNNKVHTRHYHRPATSIGPTETDYAICEYNWSLRERRREIDREIAQAIDKMIQCTQHT